MHDASGSTDRLAAPPGRSNVLLSGIGRPLFAMGERGRRRRASLAAVQTGPAHEVVKLSVGAGVPVARNSGSGAPGLVAELGRA